MSQVQVGSVWGDWTVIGEEPHKAEPSGHRRSQVKVRCACGTEKVVYCYSLVKGDSTGCAPCAQRNLKAGVRFDRLIVEGYEHSFTSTGSPRVMIKCRCDCGKIVLIQHESLKRNKTNSCGCAPRWIWQGVGSFPTVLFNRLRGRALTRGWAFEVTQEELWQVFLAQEGRCALSGMPLVFSPKMTGRGTASLDRIDSMHGYVAGNVQWLHRDVNLMKLDFTTKEFTSMCRRVSDFRSDITGETLPREVLPRGPKHKRKAT